MAVDYDVVIIGGGLAGRYAAVAATQFRATVALVEPPVKQQATLEVLTPHALTYLGGVAQQLHNVKQLGIFAAANHVDTQISVQWAAAMQWAQAVVGNLEDQSPAVLAAQGIDLIAGIGNFVHLPQIGFNVNNRHLRSRAYILATGSYPAIPEINGLAATGYCTISTIWQVLTQNPPHEWVIIGSDADALQMAQTLTRLGLHVTLIIRREHLLPAEDQDIAQLMQAILEAEGVRILTNTPIIQVKQIQAKKWIQAGEHAIETEEILVCAGKQPDIAELNLEAVGVKSRANRLLVNPKLQTTNRHIYACGDAIGGTYPHVSTYEAKIALKNALFFPVFKVNYHSIPRVIFTDPQLARVGLTETQARHWYGNDIYVLRQDFKSLTAAQLRMEITGICKIIVFDGTILGAAIIGTQAGELINAIAQCMAHKLKIDALAKLAPIYPSFSEIFAQITALARHQKITSNTALEDFLENFFSFRRSCTK